MKKFTEFVVESERKKYTAWQRPSDQNLKQEYDIEYQKHLKDSFGDFWPSFDDFLDAVKKAKVTEFNDSEDRSVANRSRTRNKDELIGLLSSYRSWGKHRNEQTTQNLYDRVAGNDTLDMPLILKTKRGMRIMAGNTRADVAMQSVGAYKALVLDVSDHV